jgi:glycerol uptake facilitator-like aquaporin
LKNHPWSKVGHYLVAQYLGAFAASAVVFITYHEAFDNYDQGTRSAYGTSTATGQIFATYPSYFLSITGSLADQVIGTALLMYAVLAVSDPKGMKIPSWLQPIFMCFVITALCIAYGYNCMAILNPARDLGPRLFTTVAGWGWASFQPLGGHYWWIAGILGPHLGAIVGGGVYLLTIDHSLKPSSSHDDITLEKNELRSVAVDGTDKEHEHLSSTKEIV